MSVGQTSLQYLNCLGFYQWKKKENHHLPFDHSSNVCQYLNIVFTLDTCNCWMEDVTRIVKTPVLTRFISESITEVSCSSAQFTEEEGQRFSNELKTF